jgi:peroxiredoxin
MIRNVTIVFLVCVYLVIPACKQGKPGEPARERAGLVTEIRGTLENGSGQKVVLDEMAAREFIPIDTVTCDDNGVFHIRFEPEQLAFYGLRTGPSGYTTLLIEPGEKIEFRGSYGRDDPYSVEGSEGSELLNVLSAEHRNTLDALGKITRRNMELQSSPDYSALKPELDRQFDSITTAFRAYSLDFITSHRESPAILIALYNLYGQGLPVFHPGKDLDVYKYVDSVLTARYGDLEAVELLHAQIIEAETSGGYGMLTGPGIGEIAPDFVSSRPDGTQMALSDLKGNYVLLSFWAGWSKLSREENIYLKEAWTKYRNQPFRILQVSFDNNKDVWLGAIEEERLDWDHISDLKRWETLVADLYHVERIPSNYLIDPEGRIVAVDLFGQELIENLEVLFSKK